jgi:hypothetical protein
MLGKLQTLGALLKRGASKENRPMFLIVLVLVMVGAIIGLGADYPILSAFLYSMF